MKAICPEFKMCPDSKYCPHAEVHEFNAATGVRNLPYTWGPRMCEHESISSGQSVCSWPCLVMELTGSSGCVTEENLLFHALVVP